MSALDFDLPWSQQPHEAVKVGDRFAGRLKFAQVASLGTFNFATEQPATDESAPMVRGVSTSGVTNDAGALFGYGTNASALNGLTCIAVWRARPAQYLFADSQRILVSNRSAGNSGWIWGRSGAVSGGATGNLTRQTFTLSGVAAYTEANHTIESLVDTPVACRYNKTTGAISWFRFGVPSSADTAGSTSPGVGDKVVLNAAGPYSSGSNQWLDRSAVVLVFEGALTDAEIFELSNSAVAPYLAFVGQSIWVPVSAGGPVIVDLAATATAQSTATAALQKGVTLAGAAFGVSTATAGLSLSVPLAATAQAVATATGDLVVTVGFAADAVATAAASAVLAVAKPLAAAATAQAAGTADAAIQKGLAAAAAAQASSSAELTLAKLLAANAQAQAAGTADLTVTGGGVVDLAAAAQAVASSSASLALVIDLSAAALAQASASASLAGSADLAAQAIADAQASAALSLGKPLSAAAQAQASAGASLLLQVPLSADALAAASAGAAIALTITLSVAAVATGNASAALAGPVTLAADGVAVASATASLQVNVGGVATAGPRVWRPATLQRRWALAALRRRWPITP